jgi:hypothetical protein
MTNAITFKVEYDTKVFDLTALQSAFDFIFELYNLLSAAKADNVSLDEPRRRLIEARNSVVNQKYPTLNNTKTKRKHEEETKDDSKRSRRPPPSGGGRDSFDDSSVQRELTRAGYTLPRLPKDFTPLTPVSRDSHRCAR